MIRYWLALLVLLAPATGLAQDWRALLSPGPVAEDHQETESQCDSCHLVFKGIPNSKCLSCHLSLRTRIADDRGYHAVVRKDACIKCHEDHKGRQGQTTTDAALKAFDHSTTGFDIEGAHKNLECADCHESPLSQMAGNCGGCHQDPHENKLGPSCQKCHNNDSWTEGLKSLKEHEVDTDGGHAELKCLDCHSDGAHLEKEVGCESCHKQEHGGTDAPCQNCHNVQAFKPAKFDHDYCTCKFPGKHRTADCVACHVDFNFEKVPTLCSGCHAKEVTHDPLGECSVCHSALTWKKNRFNHNARRSKFKLADEHLRVDCDRCHFQKKRGKIAFRAAPEQCIDCHREQGTKAHGDFGDCAKCHSTGGFETSTFDHDTTGFVVAGAHTKSECQDCHAQKTEGFPELVAEAKPTQRDCQHCHEDPHSGQAKAACDTCHVSEKWVPSTFDLVRHEKTSMPLKGLHAKAECSTCHVDGQLTGLPNQCGDCHMDRHQERLGKDCASCHNEDGWKPVPNFDHKLTGFELLGRHVKLKCAACHEGAAGKKMQATKDKKACVSCHLPEHAEDLGACKDCHSEDVPFAEARSGFDHRKTGFKLERRHAVAACKSCHPNEVAPKPIGACASCHVEPHGGQLTMNCESCHKPDRWSLVRFDHDASGWPLRGRHFVAACADCHASERWFGISTECHECHALDAARARVSVPGPHAFGALDCTDCHFNGFSWR